MIKEQATEITTIAFTDNFIDCMLGKVSVKNYIEKMKLKYPDIKEKLEYLLDPKYYDETFPPKEEVEYLYNYAKENNLLVSCGSDYHGNDGYSIECDYITEEMIKDILSWIN